MRFMLLIYNNDEAMAKLDEAETKALYADYAAFNQALAKAGVGTPGERLEGAAEGKVVRVVEGDRQVLDGPYADTKEQFAGYMMLDVPTLDEALEWAARFPSSRFGAVEVRPLFTPKGNWS